MISTIFRKNGGPGCRFSGRLIFRKTSGTKKIIRCPNTTLYQTANSKTYM